MVGDVVAKKLIAYCGSAEAVFKASKKSLMAIPGVGTRIANSIVSQDVLLVAEGELRFMEKNNIQAIYYLDEAYSFRLKQCIDAPVMLYMKGDVNLNARRFLSIVGTRNASDYGKSVTEQLIAELSHLEGLVVVSGLAYGIDVTAHKVCLKHNIPTIGVVAHGLDRLYPNAHSKIALKMIENGALMSDFISGTNPDRENFPKRNRIIAGLSDATLVVEARKKGGALITAGIANSYARDVFSVPGRVGDLNSEGCNNLIRTNQAALVQNAKDICYLMRWDQEVTKKLPRQPQLFVELTKDETEILEILSLNDKLQINLISYQSKMSISKIVQILLALEIKGLVKPLPGNQYAKS